MVQIISPQGVVLLDEVSDKSYCYNAIKGQHNLTVIVDLPDSIKIPLGSYIDFEAERYILNKPENIKKTNDRDLEYTIIFENDFTANASIRKVRNTVDKRLKFPYTATPKEHIQLLVDNLNKRDKGWKVGECIEAVEQLVNYNHTYCDDALTMIAEAFKTEYEVKQKTIHLRKVEYNKDNPLALAYGMGNGFKKELSRTTAANSKMVEILYTQGGERNIDFSKYKSKELLLPKSQQIRYDGTFFEDEEGFNSALAIAYQSDEEGFGIVRADKPLNTYAEDSLDCSNIYPSRVGVVTKVEVADKEKHFYDIIDSTIPEDLDFSQYRINGEKATIRFESGMLSGRTFDIKQTDKLLTGYKHKERRFQLVPQEQDGILMPNDEYAPRAKSDDYEGDKYAIFGIMLPDQYICDNRSKTGASWQMFRQAVKYLHENKQHKFTFIGELDGIWAKKDWENIGGKIILGGYIAFSDKHLQEDVSEGALLIRQTAIKKYLYNPHSPEITLSNETITGNVLNEFSKLEEQEVIIDSSKKETIDYTKRSYRDSKELIEAVKGMVDDFENSRLSAEVFEGMMALFGSESLQFQFLADNWVQAITPYISYDPVMKQIKCGASKIQHMTMGIDAVQPNRDISKYKFWTAPEYTSAVLTDSDQPYFLYLKASKAFSTVNGRNVGEATFFISKDKIKIDDIPNYNVLWVGYLNSENMEGDRSFRTMYGYTEILPGQITVDNIISADGNSFLRLLANQFKFGDSNSGIDWNVTLNNMLTILNASIKMINKEGETVVNIDGNDGSAMFAKGNAIFSKDGNVDVAGRIQSNNDGGDKVVIDPNDRSFKMISKHNDLVLGELKHLNIGHSGEARLTLKGRVDDNYRDEETLLYPNGLQCSSEKGTNTFSQEEMVMGGFIVMPKGAVNNPNPDYLYIRMDDLPTSKTGLHPNQLWNNNGKPDFA